MVGSRDGPHALADRRMQERYPGTPRRAVLARARHSLQTLRRNATSPGSCTAVDRLHRRARSVPRASKPPSPSSAARIASARAGSLGASARDADLDLVLRERGGDAAANGHAFITALAAIRAGRIVGTIHRRGPVWRTRLARAPHADRACAARARSDSRPSELARPAGWPRGASGTRASTAWSRARGSRSNSLVQASRRRRTRRG